MQLYYLSLSEAAALSEDWCAIHFPQRLARAKKFRQEADYLRCIGAGALLCNSLNVAESDIQYGPYGKPYIPNGPCFSISHSGNFILLAVADSAIGADIEQIQPSHIEVAERVYQPQELVWMRESPVERFFQLWTMKESVVKLFGTGLSMPLSSFSVLPLLLDGRMLYEGKVLYGHSLSMEGYHVSICLRSSEGFVSVDT